LESANQENKTFFACGGELRLMFLWMVDRVV
jgi:hypothetical protein